MGLGLQLAWFSRGDRTLDLNVAGPRESELPGIGAGAALGLRRLLAGLA